MVVFAGPLPPQKQPNLLKMWLQVHKPWTIQIGQRGMTKSLTTEFLLLHYFPLVSSLYPIQTLDQEAKICAKGADFSFLIASMQADSILIDLLHECENRTV